MKLSLPSLLKKCQNKNYYYNDYLHDLTLYNFYYCCILTASFNLYPNFTIWNHNQKNFSIYDINTIFTPKKYRRDQGKLVRWTAIALQKAERTFYFNAFISYSEFPTFIICWQYFRNNRNILELKKLYSYIHCHFMLSKSKDYLYVIKNKNSCICTTRRKKSDYKSKNTGHAFVAGLVLAILVRNSYIWGRDPFLPKSTKFYAFRAGVTRENSSNFALLWLQVTHPILAIVHLQPRCWATPTFERST